MIQHNTIFTNVAQTSDGGVFWEGLEDEIEPGVKITSWLGDDDWNKDSRQRKAAHPNSRCADGFASRVFLTGYIIKCVTMNPFPDRVTYLTRFVRLISPLRNIA